MAAPKTAAPKTKDRILTASLKLFNEHGYDAVTTARISEEVGISEGNLWYHFRTKRDLVRAHQLALFILIDRRLAIQSTPPTVLDSYAQFNRMVFEEVWTYQYLYRDQAEYGRTSPELEDRVHRIYEMTTSMLIRFFRHMIEAGHLDMPDDELAPLADNTWMVIRYWPSFLRETRRVVKLDKAALNAGIRHHFALFETHLAPKARAYFEKNAYA
ncbi:TetR/AcrR family transcriptional regulator [Parvibaculum sp.]|uniref:TetR/AcrR family transcriptional regulator n=1 Tax=Parvibaculum sp. TaxID=2024848 RepID=UPI002731C068|nr:TetR/AcrR family transcriptional regulator [Parvibaculum sp.]MDP1625936.1 TetR/AcrR family transcriptional regulator [Parvibaculum sp.]MDP2149641.1 TetR/AcrR family transcriptional regulator [Parvibaculum sp.]MDP3329617.1 TetR/AcrR family transcriptional regulator [Parvibaculum sp.]